MEMIIVSEEVLELSFVKAVKVTVCRVVLGPPKLWSVRKSSDCIQLRREFLQGFSWNFVSCLIWIPFKSSRNLALVTLLSRFKSIEKHNRI